MRPLRSAMFSVVMLSAFLASNQARATFLSGPNAISGFFTIDDETNHVIVAQSNGNITEVYWQAALTPPVSFSSVLLTTRSNLVGIAAYFSGNDGYRHVIQAAPTSGGNYGVFEYFYKPSTGHGSDTLVDTSTLSGTDKTIVSVGAYYSDIDGFQHAVFGTAAGNVYEYRWNPTTGQGYTLRKLSSGFTIKAIAGFYTADDHYEHVIVAQSGTGALTEIYWQNTGGVSQASLSGSSDSYLSIAGCYSDSRYFGSSQTRNIARADSTTTDFGYYAYGSGGWITEAVTTTTTNTVSVALLCQPAFIPAPNWIINAHRDAFRAASDNSLTWFYFNTSNQVMSVQSLVTW